MAMVLHRFIRIIFTESIARLVPDRSRPARAVTSPRAFRMRELNCYDNGRGPKGIYDMVGENDLRQEGGRCGLYGKVRAGRCFVHQTEASSVSGRPSVAIISL